MKRILSPLLALALAALLCACAPKTDVPAPAAEQPEAPAALPSPALDTPDTSDSQPQPLPDGIYTQDGTARYYQDGAPAAASGLTELDGMTLYFQPDGSLYRFTRGVNDCGGLLYYHTGEDGYSLLSPASGLYDDGEALYFVQDDASLLTDGADGYLTFGPDGRYTSGSDELDGQIAQLLALSCPDADADAGTRLELVYNYIRDHYTYLSMAHYDAGTTDWAQEAALLFLRQGKGNCYGYAAAFMYCARRLGRQAYVVAGHESRPDNDHAWTMIDEDGVSWLYDVQLEYAYLYVFDKGEIDVFHVQESDGLYNGFQYFFPEA